MLNFLEFGHKSPNCVIPSTLVQQSGRKEGRKEAQIIKQYSRCLSYLFDLFCIVVERTLELFVKAVIQFYNGVNRGPGYAIVKLTPTA